MAEEKLNCENREVVHAEGRLHSPKYDYDGDPGLAQSYGELIDQDAMCFFGLCSSSSYNAWVKATEKYINGRNNPSILVQYNKNLAEANKRSQGAPLNLDLQNRFNQIKDFIKEWDAADYKPDKDWFDDTWHPFRSYWWGEIRVLIEYFDRAACLMDELNLIAIDVNKSPSLAAGPSTRTVTPSPTGSFLDGSGGGSGGGGGGGSGSFVGKAVGIMAIGAAGYFGFKVLTE